MLAWMMLLFVTVPLVELALLVRVGARLGLVPTIAIVVVTGILGAALARQQGVATWRRFQSRLAAGELPHEDLLDGLLILVAGAVLLTPGLLTDAAGFLLLVPPARSRLRRVLAARLGGRVHVASMDGPGPPRPASSGADDVVDAEYTVDDG